jgi:hypothetical protein
MMNITDTIRHQFDISNEKLVKIHFILKHFFGL